MSKVAVVTGSNTGIGFQTAQALCAQGYTVVMACRSEENATKAMAELKKAQKDAKVEFLQLDTSSFASAKAFAEKFNKQFTRLDALVLNAGTGYVAKEKRVTEDGNEAFLQVNYLSHWLLTQHLVPVLKKTAEARVVCLSSVEHRDGTTQWDKLNAKTSGKSYPASKLAMALFAYELAKRTGVAVAAVNPGAVSSDIWRYMDKHTGIYTTVHKMVQKTLFLTPVQGCATSVYAATSPLPAGECLYVSPYAETSCCPQWSDTLGFYNGPTVRKPDRKAIDTTEMRRLWEFSAQKCEKFLP